MNPSHVVYGACMRDCGVEGYGGLQGPRKLLDNGDFVLATWEHQSPSPLRRVLQCGSANEIFSKHFLLSIGYSHFPNTIALPIGNKPFPALPITRWKQAISNTFFYP
ncbi:hypothetical protein Pyn_27026 [Prunus yedoensis var. nudiflora]|uniref:Uncharacterized protein n=1 Tax=Prunus yedoensis var. nudiflora TaxID=2094558 RepID=A0A314V006_PRUYE|nr:hypothetical protein Pyn_27026 [Prunus yedoensis var. nudiflora]